MQTQGIADTDAAMILQEAGHAPMVLFPRHGVETVYSSRTGRPSHCPYKGGAVFYTLLRNGEFAEKAVCPFEEPYPAVEPIAGMLAFSPRHTEVYAIPLADASRRQEDPVSVDEVVLHVHRGSGESQARHWPVNVSMPDGTEERPEDRTLPKGSALTAKAVQAEPRRHGVVFGGLARELSL